VQNYKMSFRLQNILKKIPIHPAKHIPPPPWGRAGEGAYSPLGEGRGGGLSRQRAGEGAYPLATPTAILIPSAALDTMPPA
jgi:hypothetical protein